MDVPTRIGEHARPARLNCRMGHPPADLETGIGHNMPSEVSSYPRHPWKSDGPLDVVCPGGAGGEALVEDHGEAVGDVTQSRIVRHTASTLPVVVGLPRLGDSDQRENAGR